MFVEVTYKVGRDKDRLAMYEDMEKRENSGQQVVTMVPFELVQNFLGHRIIEVMLVLYRSKETV